VIGLTSKRYLVLDDGGGLPEYIEHPRSLREDPDPGEPFPEKKPRCGVDDLLALRNLLMKTGQYEPGKERRSSCGRVFGLVYEDTVVGEPEVMKFQRDMDVNGLQGQNGSSDVHKDEGKHRDD